MNSTTADIRQENFFAIVRSIHAATSASRRQLVAATGLSFATVSAICANLIDLGVLVESSREKAVAGRPTSKLALNPNHGILIGVDIAETYIHVESFNTSLESVSSTHHRLDTLLSLPSEVAGPVKAAIWEEINRHRDSTILGIGISAPGLVEPSGGTSLFAPNWAWRNVPLLPLLNDAFPAPIHLDNPLKYLTIAELWANPQRVRQNFVSINIGTGVGAGIAFSGTLFRGSTNSAGEWGHSVIVADGRPCRCGSRGCVEAYVGAPGVIRTLAETDPTSPLLRGDDQTATMQALSNALADKDPVAQAVVDTTSRYLAVGIASIINILNPEAIIIGGWVTGVLGEHMLERVRHYVGEYALDVPLAATVIELRWDKVNSVSLGAAASALEFYFGASKNRTKTLVPTAPGALPWHNVHEECTSPTAATHAG